MTTWTKKSHGLPEGYSEYLEEKKNMNVSNKEYCQLLQKSIYGLVQAA
jgi:hypothetical protein